MAKKPGNPNLVKGVSGNPGGRPKGTGLKPLLEAIREWEKKTGRNYYSLMVEKSVTNPVILVAIMKKLVPDLEQIEHSGEVKIEIIAPTKGILVDVNAPDQSSTAV